MAAFLTVKPKIPGSDLSGVVEDVGGSTKWQRGDRVFALTDGYKFSNNSGCFAEYMAVPEDQLAAMPANVDFNKAAAVPCTALTAWQALDKIKMQAGKRILIQAGSGGVGAWLVQLAKYRGFHVTATCSTPNVDFVKGLGADVVIDYTQQHISESISQSGKFDAAVDCVGGQVETETYFCLSRRGSFSAIMNPGMSISNVLFRFVKGLLRLGPRYSMVFCGPNGRQLAQIASLIGSGKALVDVDKVFPLAQAAAATEYFEGRRGGHGKVVLAVAA
ncbi:hypothetical protein WJX84_000773 [Apatococcus fuscideae]|uniref:Enoyl reductase (ER) domain-containing protein n=1 Tax=Apatococcus fuscideae TaxID=2026836 RepID=A0AAW1THM4_9CHLO